MPNQLNFTRAEGGLVATFDKTGSVAVLARMQKRFALLFSLSVLILSFVVGLVIGLKQNVPSAYASSATTVDAHDAILNTSLLPFPLSSEQGAVREWRNGAVHERLSFESETGVRQSMSECAASWEQRGWHVIGATSEHRGMAAAVDRRQGRIYTLLMWSLPNGNSRGFLSLKEIALSAADLATRKRHSGIELPPTARSGATVQADDPSGRTVTSSLSVEMPLDRATEHFKAELIADGWTLVEQQVAALNALPTASQKFSRQAEELMLIYSQVPNSYPRRTALISVRGFGGL